MSFAMDHNEMTMKIEQVTGIQIDRNDVGVDVQVQVVKTESGAVDAFVKHGPDLLKFGYTRSGWTKSYVTEKLFEKCLKLNVRTWSVFRAGGKTLIFVHSSAGLDVFEDSGTNVKKITKESEPTISEDFGYRIESGDGNSVMPIVVYGMKDADNFFAIGRNSLGDLDVQMVNVKSPGTVQTKDQLKDRLGAVIGVENIHGYLEHVIHRLRGNLELSDVENLKHKTSYKIDTSDITFERALATEADLLYFNDMGLHIFSLKTSNAAYTYCSEFSANRGWNQEYLDSIRVIKLGAVKFAFTGPKGLGFFEIVDKICQITTMEISTEPKDFKHTLLSGAFDDNGALQVIGYYNNGIQLVQCRLSSATDSTQASKVLKYDPPKLEIKQTHLGKIDPNLKLPVNRWMRESFDESAFKNAVNKVTGQVGFKFPLVDLGERVGLPIRQMVYYDDSEQHGSSALGRYWTFGKDCIVVDRQDTVFEELHEYYLVKDTMKVWLSRDWVGSVKGKVKFTVSGADELTATYFPGEEKWICENNKVQYIYGRVDSTLEAISYTTGFDSWLGYSKSYAMATPKAYQWNLVQIKDKSDASDVVTYSYGKEDKMLDGKTFSKLVNLKEIQYGNGGSVKFTYDNARAHGTGKGGDPLSKLLKNIVIKTPIYEQHLNFVYEGNGDDFYLSSIGQSSDPKGNTFLAFQYQNAVGGRKRISQVSLPSGTNVNYEYEANSFETDQFNQQFPQNRQLFTSPHYSLVVETQGKAKVVIEVKDASCTNNFAKLVKFYPRTSDRLESTSAVISKDYFVVSLYHEKKGVTLLLYHKDGSGAWVETESDKYNKTHSFPDGSKLKMDTQDDCVVIYTEQKVDFFIWNVTKSEWNTQQRTLNSAVAMAFINHGVIYLDSQHKLKMVRFDERKSMKETELKGSPYSVPNLSSDIDTIFNVILLEPVPNSPASKSELEKYIKDAKNVLTKSSMVMFNNILAVRTIKLETTGAIQVTVYLYYLNKSYEVVKQEQTSLTADDLNTYKLTVDVNSSNGLQKVTFKFQNNNNRYKVYVSDIRDQNGNIPQQEALSQAEKEEYSRRMNIPLDFEKYFMHVNNEGILCANYTLSYDGSRFSEHLMDSEELKLNTVNISLGQFMKLTKPSRDSPIKLVTHNGNTLHTFETKLANNVSIKYPNYLLDQTRDKLEVIPISLDQKGILNKITLQGEVAHKSTSHSLLLTFDKNNVTYTRPIRDIKGTVKNPVVKKETITGLGESYTNQYKYFDPILSGNEVLYKRVHIIPGLRDSRYGYFEEVMDFTNSSQNVAVYDSSKALFDPEYLKRIEERKKLRENQTQQPTIVPESVIFDRSGLLPIVNAAPYTIADDVVGYIGFEKYEKNDPKWVYPQAVEENKFSGTGSNYLKLSQGQELRRTFKPSFASGTFIASSWIRTNQKFELGDPTVGIETDVLTVSTTGGRGQHVKGKVKQQIDEWYYVEAIVDMDLNVQFNLVIKATRGEIHLDHVRFSPAEFNFQANVYDPHTAKRIAVIHSNGLATRFLHDDYGKKIAELSEQGRVKYLASYSRRFSSAGHSDGRQFFISRVSIRPRIGVLVQSSPYIMEYFWNNVNTIQKVAPNLMALTGNVEYKHKFTSDTISFRTEYKLDGSSFALKIGTTLILSVQKTNNVPDAGELILLVTPNFWVLWIDGTIVKSERTSQAIKDQKLTINTPRQVLLKNVMVMDGVEVMVSYLNREQKALQEISMVDFNHMVIRQIQYDEIGRKSLETLSTKVPTTAIQSQNYFQFNEQFLRKGSNQKLAGLVNQYNENANGYPYSAIQYYNIPLEIQQKIGNPGKEFSLAEGTFVNTFTINTTIPYLNLRYPVKLGFRHEQETKPNGILHVTVVNSWDKKVAEYIRAGDYNDLLTTYEYDQYGNLIEVLPPNYHEQVKSLQSAQTNQQTALQMNNSEERRGWQIKSEYYEGTDLVKTRRTPDAGKVEFIYNELKQLRFQFHYDGRNKVDKILYYLYNSAGKIREIGTLDARFENELRLKTSTEKELPETKVFLQFNYGESAEVPAARGRMLQSHKQNAQSSFSEVLFFDEDENVIRKSYLHPTDNTTLSLEYFYENDKIAGIKYPVEVKNQMLTLVYDHNLRGEVTAIKDATGNTLVTIDHNGQGKVTQLHHAIANFNQDYTYNAPGHLLKIENPYLVEYLTYDRGGYGAKPSADGSILRTEFHALWHDKCDRSKIPLKPTDFVSKDMRLKFAEICFNALKEKKFFDEQGRPLKTFYPESHLDLPIKCSTGVQGMHVSNTLLSKGFPKVYGHAYNYGSHAELVAAKSFINGENKTLTEPLTRERFEKMSPPISNAKEVWRKLTEASIISTGLPALEMQKFFVTHFNELDELLYRSTVLKSLYAGKTNKDLCQTWYKGQRSQVDNCLSKASQYKPTPNSKLALDDTTLQQVIRVLAPLFATELGKSPADVHSFSIDKNGNHKLFYTGFARYAMEYKDYTNQITAVKVNSNDRGMQIDYDSEGNIVKALHRNIQSIKYDPLSSRASEIVLPTKTLEFAYDYRGERTAKRVRNSAKQLTSQTMYIRDHKGNCLVEFKEDFPNPKQLTKPIITVTAYVYGPIGLIGFYRNNQYYTVLLDHEGSTRLILKGNQVVAAYDYLPYGQLFRRYGSDPDAHISYLYTGQELDPETGLYNYHARLYDPDLGRFYQVDPQDQYASPYKYAGNSPVSLIDPDGEFAVSLLIMAIGAIVGAYLGAASANNSWDPAEWKWNEGKTWLGLFMGAMMGAFAVYGGGATFAYFTSLFGGSMIAGALATGAFAVAGALLGAAGASNEWNPSKWDWSSPAVWNGLFTGASIAINLPSGFVGVTRTFYTIVSTMGKSIYAGALGTGFLLFGYLGGAFANNFEFSPDKWEWKSPKTIFGIFEGSTTIFVGTSAGVKHGAQKSYYVIKANNMPVTWYRIHVPKSSFTIKHLPYKKVITFYSYGRKVGVKYIPINHKTVAYSVPKYVGYTKGFFVGTSRQVASQAFMLQMVFTRYKQYELYFQNPSSNSTALATTKPDISGRRRKRESPYTSSGAESLNNLFTNFFADLINFFAPTQKPSIKLGTPLGIYNPRNRDTASSQKVYQKYCYSPDKSRSHFMCSQPKSTIRVFSKDSSFDKENFGHDSFSRCVPIFWQDRPSVSCQGEQSTFIYTPREASSAFDYVDGWLLLARVTPVVYSELKGAAKYLLDMVRGGSDSCKKVAGFNQEELTEIQKQLGEDLTEIEQLATKYDWSNKALHFLKEDIEELFHANGQYFSHNNYEVIKERLFALKEDIQEVENYSLAENPKNIVENQSREVRSIDYFNHDTHSKLHGCRGHEVLNSLLHRYIK